MVNKDLKIFSIIKYKLIYYTLNKIIKTKKQKSKNVNNHHSGVLLVRGEHGTTPLESSLASSTEIEHIYIL